ncbi:MAG TPA: hypothetical protein VNI78_05755 [Vicinamibacterales bacterium]|nr:hypothetical protein [Vicinamibacterales bacterium]
MSRIVELTSQWWQLKKRFGIEPADELKYNLAENHPTRGRLDANGWTQAQRVPEMLKKIAELDVTILANTLVDHRGGRSTCDLYVDTFKWCVRRFANHIEFDLRRPPGPHAVVVDMPPVPRDPSDRSDRSDRSLSQRLQALLENPGTAPFDAYAEMYAEAEMFVQRGSSGTPLRDLDFVPTLLAAHAKHADLLQITDVIASAMNEFCAHNLNRSANGPRSRSSYPDDNFQILAPRIRADSRQERIRGYGFDVFPGSDGVEALLARAEELRQQAVADAG